MISAGKTNPAGLVNTGAAASHIVFGEGFVMPESAQYNEGASSYQRGRRRSHLLAEATSGAPSAGVLGVISEDVSWMDHLNKLFADRDNPTTEIQFSEFQDTAAKALGYLNSNADEHSKLSDPQQSWGLKKSEPLKAIKTYRNILS